MLPTYSNQPPYYNPRAQVPPSGQPPMNMGGMQPPGYAPHMPSHHGYSHPPQPAPNYPPYYNNPPSGGYRGYPGYGAPPPPHQGMYMNPSPPMNQPMMGHYNPNVVPVYPDPSSIQLNVYETQLYNEGVELIQQIRYTNISEE